MGSYGPGTHPVVFLITNVAVPGRNSDIILLHDFERVIMFKVNFCKGGTHMHCVDMSGITQFL